MHFIGYALLIAKINGFGCPMASRRQCLLFGFVYTNPLLAEQEKLTSMECRSDSQNVADSVGRRWA